MAIGALGLVSSARGGDLFTINFDTGYKGSETYTSATSTDTGLKGSAPDKPTDFQNGGATAPWTATVTPSGTDQGNYLKFDIPGKAPFSGRMEAFKGDAGIAAGIVHFAFDFTRLSEGGGPVFLMKALTNDGQTFASDNVYLDAFVGDEKVTFTTGKTYNIDTIIDLDKHTFQIVAGGILVKSGTTPVFTDKQFCGFVLEFIGTGDDARSFAIDNLVAGPVVEELR